MSKIEAVWIECGWHRPVYYDDPYFGIRRWRWSTYKGKMLNADKTNWEHFRGLIVLGFRVTFLWSTPNDG